MKIIKHGNRIRKYPRKTTCPTCGCIFVFDTKDVIPDIACSTHRAYSEVILHPFVQCPECEHIFASDSEEFDDRESS